MINIGEYIKEKRNEKEISQRELARRINIDNGTIAKIERGKIKKPSIDTLKKINAEINNNEIEELDKMIRISGYTTQELMNLGIITSYKGISGGTKLEKYLVEEKEDNYLDIIKALQDYKKENLNENEILGLFSILIGKQIETYIHEKIMKKYNIKLIETIDNSKKKNTK